MFELVDKPAQQRHRLVLVARIPMHLPAARLPCRKLDRMPKPLQHPHYRFARIRKQRVVITGNKQRNLQTIPPLSLHHFNFVVTAA
jgi:hypothetical protein